MSVEENSFQNAEPAMVADADIYRLRQELDLIAQYEDMERGMRQNFQKPPTEGAEERVSMAWCISTLGLTVMISTGLCTVAYCAGNGFIDACKALPFG